MDRVVQIFDGPEGFARANAADRASYESLSPQQRLDIAIHAVALHGYPRLTEDPR